MVFMVTKTLKKIDSNIDSLNNYKVEQEGCLVNHAV